MVTSNSATITSHLQSTAMEKVFQEASTLLLFQLDRIETAIITIPPRLQGRCRKDQKVEKYVTDMKQVAEVVNACSTKLTLVRKSTGKDGKISNFIEICSEFTGGISHLVDCFLAFDGSPNNDSTSVGLKYLSST